ncbi:hypothetical protein AKJ41_03785 [candidate division MSBL1 archaeon SCGC-AAA259O05]|uniref:Uncharacterized protein n=1 Tax=candidate division MSBL1 archaeon SCGC-AAA259O05 TaxID=1698271 RepID=A0A133V2M3_9EURY|nr:hypothetical protein AKJ41_03785 [candidate division MSBL1 archaeon SCGC-AAA259O05]
MSKTVTTRVDEKLSERIDEIAEEEGLDRSTVVRKFLADGTKNWLIEKSFEDYEAGRITLWQAADRCGLSLWEMIQEARKREVHVPYTVDELEEDLRALE